MDQRPPREVERRALALARRLNRAVYLYGEAVTDGGPGGEGPGGTTWRTARRPGEIPAGAAAFVVRPDPDDPERGNRGGC
jgi:hypothetical protein